MELYIISFLAFLVFIFACVACAATYKWLEAKHKLSEMKNQYATSSNKEIELQGAVTSAQYENMKLRDRMIEAETHLDDLKKQFSKIEGERIEAVNALHQTEKNYHDALNNIELTNKLANQKIQESERRINDWEKQREQAFKDAREAMFTTGKEVFNKEAEEVRKKTFEQFGKIAERVSALSGSVDSTSKDIKTVIKAMSSPAAVGQFSEVGLANILKEYGLIEGQDFIIQYSIGAGEGAKRPDAVLFVRDNIFIIDSKASKFFLDFAEAEGTAREHEVLENIKKSMNKHLSDLSTKGYREAVIDEIRKTRADFEIGHVQTVMFLCNEAHINKLAYADPEFISKAIAKDIVISGPTGLQGLLAFARYSIARGLQEENQEHIILEIGNLLGSISTVVGHALKVGSGIKSAAQNYEKLVVSINSNLLSKASKITKLGVTLPNNKQLPNRLGSFAVVDNSSLIDSEAVNEEVEIVSENSRVLELMEV